MPAIEHHGRASSGGSRGPARGLAPAGAVSLLIVLFLAAVCLGGEQQDASPSPRERCPVCGMFVAPFADWNGEVEFSDATHRIFDGPKDTFKYYLDVKKYEPSRDKGGITAVRVKDYYSASSIDAFKAFYVIWSDIYGPMGHEPVPFEKEGDARKFLKEHKGKRILRFRDITTKVILSLDNP